MARHMLQLQLLFWMVVIGMVLSIHSLFMYGFLQLLKLVERELRPVLLALIHYWLHPAVVAAEQAGRKCGECTHFRSQDLASSFSN